MPDYSNKRISKWIAAARLKTLSGAAAPVLIACSLALADSTFNINVAILALLFALLMQIDANLINDLYDFLKGSDNETRLGPERACAQGWITPKAMKRGIIVTSAIALVTGSFLLFYGGIELLFIGLLCLLFAFLYTAGPYPLAYYGCGDLLVIIFFGIVPVCTTYYIMAQSVNLPVILISIACGVVTDTLLVLNNYRDRNEDAKSKKITTVVILGEKWGERLYLILGFVGLALSIGALSLGGATLFSLLLLPYATLHLLTWRKMVKINSGKPLNIILAETSRNIIVFALLLCAAIILQGA